MAKSLILSVGCALTAIFAEPPTTPASAQTIGTTCPAAYEVLIDNQCIEYESGYIVLARAPPTAPRYTNTNCLPGYEILIDHQCIDFQTGYIDSATEAAFSATQAARK